MFIHKYLYITLIFYYFAVSAAGEQQPPQDSTIRRTEKKLAAPLVNAGAAQCSKSGSLKETTDLIWDIPAVIESLRTGRVNTMLPSLMTEFNRLPPLYLTKDRTSFLQKTRSVQCRFTIDLSPRFHWQYPTRMEGQARIARNGNVKFMIDSVLPCMVMNFHAFPAPLPFLALSCDREYLYTYYDHARDRGIPTYHLADTKPSKSMYSLLGTYGLNAGAASYRYILSRGHRKDTKKTKTVFDANRLVSFSFGPEGTVYIEGNIQWKNTLPARLQIRVNPVTVSIRDESFAYDVRISSNNHAVKQYRVHPKIEFSYPAAPRLATITFQPHDDLGIIPASIMVSDTEGSVLDRIQLSSIEFINNDDPCAMDEFALHSWNRHFPLWDTVNDSLVCTPGDVQKQKFRDYVDDFRSGRIQPRTPYATRIAITALAVLGDNRGAAVELDRYCGRLEERGLPLYGVVETEAAARWAYECRLPKLSTLIVDLLRKRYESLGPVEDHMARLTRHRDYVLAYMLADIRADGNKPETMCRLANKLLGDEMHTDNRKYAVFILRHIFSNWDGFKRTAIELLNATDGEGLDENRKESKSPRQKLESLTDWPSVPDLQNK